MAHTNSRHAGGFESDLSDEGGSGRFHLFTICVGLHVCFLLYINRETRQVRYIIFYLKLILIYLSLFNLAVQRPQQSRLGCQSRYVDNCCTVINKEHLARTFWFNQDTRRLPPILGPPFWSALQAALIIMPNVESLLLCNNSYRQYELYVSSVK